MNLTDEMRAVLAQHEFMEAVGGYTECSCGWPSKEEYDAGGHEMEHVLELLIPLVRKQFAQEFVYDNRGLPSSTEWQQGYRDAMRDASEELKRRA